MDAEGEAHITDLEAIQSAVTELFDGETYVALGVGQCEQVYGYFTTLLAEVDRLRAAHRHQADRSIVLQETIDRLCKEKIQLRSEEYRLRAEGFAMSGELTYMHGVLCAAAGKDYPSDLGCENHEVVLLVDRLRAENAVLREALEHYASKDNWDSYPDGSTTECVWLGYRDGWAYAEEALDKLKEGGK